MKKVLVLGAAGCVGYAAAKEFSKDINFKTFGTYHKNPMDLKGVTEVEMDINNAEESVKTIEKISPDVIITCIIQRDYDKEFSFNEKLAGYAAKSGCRVYFCSTGNAIKKEMSGPYYEDCDVAPDCDYGEYKVHCEKMFQERIPDRVCIMRLPQIWGKRSKHFKRLIDAAKSGTAIELYSKMIFNVNSDEMLARQIHYIVENSWTGIVHLAATDTISYKDFMLDLLKRCGFENPKYTETDDAGNMAMMSLRSADFPKELHITNEEVIEYTSGVKEKR